jgi:hypothetical protein
VSGRGSPRWSLLRPPALWWCIHINEVVRCRRDHTRPFGARLHAELAPRFLAVGRTPMAMPLLFLLANQRPTDVDHLTNTHHESHERFYDEYQLSNV